MQYEVIMTDIAHTMQRDGEIIVFGDVMFGLPNNGRSRGKMDLAQVHHLHLLLASILAQKHILICILKTLRK